MNKSPTLLYAYFMKRVIVKFRSRKSKTFIRWNYNEKYYCKREIVTSNFNFYILKTNKKKVHNYIYIYTQGVWNESRS